MDPTPGDDTRRTIGPFEILREVGRGGMGVVYEAFQPALNRTVALKVLVAGRDAGEEALARFHREAEAVARLGHHPHIVPVYDVGRAGPDAGTPGAAPLHYIAMHFVKGVSLDRALEDRPLSPRRAAEIARAVALALAHAHGRGILHRDVKPANILLAAPEGDGGRGGEAEHPSPPPPLRSSPPRDEGTRGQPMLTDFGLAKDVMSETQLTSTGRTVGTPQYMPPEQAAGRLDDVDERSDVWGLGAVLYEMLTLEPPFDGASVAEVLRKVHSDDPVSPRTRNPDVDRDLETLCLVALQKDPKHRFPSARAFADDLGRWLDRRPVEARRPSPAARLLGRARRNRAATALAAAAVVLLLLAGVAGALALTSLARSGRETRARREDGAEAGRRAEREALALEKGRRAAAVLRDADAVLGAAYRRILESWGGREEVSAETWAEVEAFERSVPDDPTARASWHAAKGWLLHLAGREAEALDRFASARKEDPDVPYGVLFEALAALGTYLEGQILAPFSPGEDGIVFDPLPPETEEMGAARLRFEDAVRRVAQAPGWGATQAADFVAILEGFRRGQEGDFTTAEKALSKALSLPEMVWFQVPLRFARAKVRFFAGRFAEAREDMAAVTDVYPLSRGVNYLLAEIHVGEGLERRIRGEDPRASFERAAALFERFTGDDPMDRLCRHHRVSVLNFLAEADAADGLDARPAFDRALAAADALVAEDPGDADAWTNRAEILVDRAKAAPGGDGLSRAVSDCTEALRLEPGHANALGFRLVANVLLGEEASNRGGDAEGCFRHAVEDGRALEKLRGERASTHVNLGSALVWLGRALASQGRDPRKEYREGVAHYEEALAREQGDATTLVFLAEGLGFLAEEQMARGEDPWASLDRAEAALERVRRAGPRRAAQVLEALAKVRVRRGDARARRGEDPAEDYEKALEAFDAALDARPGDGPFLGNRGALHVKRGDLLQARGGAAAAAYEKAVADVTAALEAEAGNARFLCNRAAAFEGLAEVAAREGADPTPWWDRALEDCTAAVARKPDFAGAYSRRGNVALHRARRLLAAGKDPRPWFDKAGRDFDEAVRLAPSAPQFRLNRGVFRTTMAEALAAGGADAPDLFVEAVSDLREAVRLAPSSRDGHFKLGCALSAQGQHEAARGRDPTASLRGAVEAYTAAIRLLPRDAASLNNRGNARRVLGEILHGNAEDAREALQRAVEDFDASLDLDPDELLPWCNRAQALKAWADAEAIHGGSDAELLDRALDSYARCEERFPRQWKVPVNRGMLLEALGRFEEAAEAYEKAVRAGGSVEPDVTRLLDHARLLAAQPPCFREVLAGLKAFNRGAFGRAAAHVARARTLAAESGAPPEGDTRRALAQGLVLLACVRALASTGKDAPWAPPRDVAVKEQSRLLDEAMEALREGFALGLPDLKLVEREELDPLRERKEFKALLEGWKEGRD